MTGLSIALELECFVRILMASLCGCMIGYERTRRLKEAGVRTHCVVACGAALMMVVSKYGFADIIQNGVYLYGSDGVDASRIASQVVTGVGFLGAGVIFRTGTSVKGLTTAAGIWATSAVGLAFGAGLYLIGLADHRLHRGHPVFDAQAPHRGGRLYQPGHHPAISRLPPGEGAAVQYASGAGGSYLWLLHQAAGQRRHELSPVHPHPPPHPGRGVPGHDGLLPPDHRVFCLILEYQLYVFLPFVQLVFFLCRFYTETPVFPSFNVGFKKIFVSFNVKFHFKFVDFYTNTCYTILSTFKEV